MHPPTFIFLENVLNFETSECRKRVVETLERIGYTFEEYLLSPMDTLIGIPNDRLRYYLIARLVNEVPEQSHHIIKSFSEIYGEEMAITPKRITEFILPESDADTSLFIKEKYITEYKNYRHDVVHPNSTRSTTFTKAYGSDYIIGTGSFLQTARLELEEYPKDNPELLLGLKLRFFHPKEIARLHAFPEWFRFAPGTTQIQQYRLLGNSMNVLVVTLLLKRLFLELK